MIYLGIDDTDIVGSPGTNQLARLILKHLGDKAKGAVICRHQLFFDSRVPYTSKNGSASIQLPGLTPNDVPSLIKEVRDVMLGWYVVGSDPGLCVATTIPDEMKSFSQRCKHEVVTQDEARSIAHRAGCHLEGLGGTNQGIIGALAAVGLIVDGNDGRIVHLASWRYPDDEFTGPRTIEELRSRGVDEIRVVDSGELVTSGLVTIKHLRPNLRNHRIVLYVEPSTETNAAWRAVKLA